MSKQETWFVLGKKGEKISRFVIENSETCILVENFEYGFVLEPQISSFFEVVGIPGGWKFSGQVTPGEVLFNILDRLEERCAFVESCTGGLCCTRLTEMPGSSRVLWGGWVVYSNEAKVLLGVPQEVLRNFGAVSKQTVLELARAGRVRSGADWCVSISGIAGPEGGSPEKPVGTVWIGINGKDGNKRAVQFRFAGGRAGIREKASAAAFLFLHQFVQGKKKKSGC
jgi:PncC family amidohydrolase